MYGALAGIRTGMSAAIAGPSSTSMPSPAPANTRSQDLLRRFTGVDIFSASVVAVSFAMTAIMPVRCHQKNQIKPSIPRQFLGIGRSPSQNMTKVGRNLFPTFIASNSQLQEGSAKMRRMAASGDVRATPRFDQGPKRVTRPGGQPGGS